MEALLLSLILWINQNSTFNYDINRGLPILKQADQMTLATYVVDDPSTLTEERDTPSFQNFINQLEAVYDPEHKTIFISSKIDLKSKYARSVILHELVHFIQYQHRLNEQADCPNALEKDAYNLQGRYMDFFHIPKNFDQGTIALRSMCWNFEE